MGSDVTSYFNSFLLEIIMKFDDKINLSEEGVSSIEPEIINHIKRNFPEFLDSDFNVSIEFIRIVDKTYWAVLDNLDDSEMTVLDYGENEMVDYDYITDQEAEEILKKLPAEVRSQPLSLDTVSLILEEMEELAYLEWKKSEENERNMQCSEAKEFAKRGSAKAAVKQFNEALQDYNKACLLNPKALGYFLDRANLFMEMGLKGNAFKDAIFVYERKGDNFFKDFTIYFPDLTYIFHECGKSLLTIELILEYLKNLTNPSLLPFITIKNYMFVIEASNNKISGNIDLFKEIITIIKEIELENKGDNKIEALIESAKSELVFLRKVVGF